MTSVELLPATTYTVEEWDRPKTLPDRGIAIPTLSRREFEFYFTNIDPQVWEMTQAQRETWKNDILDDWFIYRRVLYRNGTGIFHQQLRDMDRMGGGIILIPGEMGTGKSILANTLLKIWNVLKKNTDPPHIFWSKNEVRAKIRATAPNTAHSIDEDMRSTGRGSGNLEVHLKNLFETIRKTGKLAVDVGVNVESNRLARAVGLQLFPIGFNRRYQANRFIVCNWKGRPLWLATTQRFYYPNEAVLYEGELGCFGEYDNRAREFSRTTTGVFAGSNAEQELEWRTQLVEHWNKDWKGITPSIDVLEFEAIQIGIPQESVATIKRICASAKMVLRKDKVGRPPKKKSFGAFSKDWAGMRQFIEQWCLKHDPAREEYATATALWIVPDSPPLSQDDVFDLIDFGANPVKAGTLGREIRKLRKRIQKPDIEFTDFTEAWVASQLDSLGARKAGGKGAPDIVLEGGKQVAVKFCVRNDPFYNYTVSPETDGTVIIIIPRRLQFFVIPIADNVVNEHLQLDNTRVREGGVLVGIEGLVDAVREFMIIVDTVQEVKT